MVTAGESGHHLGREKPSVPLTLLPRKDCEGEDANAKTKMTYRHRVAD